MKEDFVMGYKHEEKYIEKVKEIQSIQDAEKYRLYMQWCDECPKAHNFTCSGADAKKCEQEKTKVTN